jgi:hypothetical protein
MDDKLFINLKILSKLQKNGRLSRSSDGIIALENGTFYEPIKRFVTSDSRKQTVFEVNSIINETIKAMEHIVNSKYSNKMYFKSNEYYKNCVNLSLILNELKLAKNGIDNLKFTYKSDINIGSQLDILIVKIDTTIKDMTHKLTFFQNYLPDHLKAELLEEQRKLEPHYNMTVSNEQVEESTVPEPVYQQLSDETDKPSWGDDNYNADDDSTSPLDMTDV